MHSSGPATLAAAHSAWQTAVSQFITAVLGTYWAVDQQCTALQTDQLDPATGRNVAQANSAVSYKGTGAGNPIDPRSCVVTGLRTALPTRSGRGRMYWPAVQDSSLSPTGLILSSVATAIANGWSSALNTMATTSQPVIYHPLTRTTTAVTSVTVGQVLGTQRRRTNKIPPGYASSPL